MPAGPTLIKCVSLVLNGEPKTPNTIRSELFAGGVECTTRAIRYAIAELIKSGRAKRKGQSGPVYAVKETV
jgi:predicted HTH transcriptional regulator